MSKSRPDANSLDDYCWLVDSAAEKWLNDAHSAVIDAVPLIQLATRLRKNLSAERAHLILQQIELRRKAEDKFPWARRMFFTPLGLEQATDSWVAAYKAARFTAGHCVADLCCGIGGDLLALADRASTVMAIDRNPVATTLAEANLRAVCIVEGCDPRHAVKFEVRDVADAVPLLNDAAALHIDPDRRASGRRTTKIQLHDPGPDVLERLLSACPNICIKLAPATDVEERIWADAELEWISRGRQCRQLVAWFGTPAQQPGQRRATIVRRVAAEGKHFPYDASTDNETFVGDPNLQAPVVKQIGLYLLEPDAAVLAAKLEGAIAAHHNLSAITPTIAYFTADHPIRSHLLDCFEVQGVMTYRVSILRHWLAVRNIGRLEVKKRGVPLDPENVRRELLAGAHGSEEMTLLLARIDGQITAILAKRIH
jgi:hypothetical protein